MSASPFFTTPILALNRLGWIGLGDSRVLMMDALGGFYSLREQIAQEIGSDAEAEMVQRAGFAAAERLVIAGSDSGELTPDADGFHKALMLLSFAGYGQLRATEVRFDEQWARVVAENSVEGWTFRETGTRASASCDFLRGMLAGVMHYLWQASQSAESEDEEELAGLRPFADETASAGPAEAGDGAEINCIEIACIANGEQECHFALGPAHLLIAEGLTPATMAQSSVRETLLRLNRQLEQILDSSRKDPLTRLYNRSYFETALRQRIGFAKRRSDVVSLAIIDIDSFKSINDTHGHTVGDRVLRQIARSLEQQARENDVVARLGGDEFVWLMPATPGEAAHSVAQRLRRTVEELSPSMGFDVTVSIGVANYPQDASAPTDLFDHADMALFAAKRAGRDQAVRYDAAAIGAAPLAQATPAATPAPQTAQEEPAAPSLGPTSGPTATAAARSLVKSRRGSAAVQEPPTPEAVAAAPVAAVHARNGRLPAAPAVDVPERDPATEEAFPQPRGPYRMKKVRY